MHAMRWTVVLIAAMAMSTPVIARQSPYCIKGCNFAGGAGDCSFATYQQCLATASGRDAWCAENPYSSAKAMAPGDRSRPSQRRF